MANNKYVKNVTSEEIIGFYTENIYEPMVKLHGSTPAVWKYKPCYIGDITREEDGSATFRVLNDCYKVTDFDFECSANTRMLSFVHNKEWLKFMYTKFGKPYLQDFMACRKAEEEQAARAAAERSKKQTEEYLDAMNEESK